MKLMQISLATAITLVGVGLASPANANCVTSQWSLTSGNSLASTIYGRQCGANMSVRFTGAVNTGWIAMFGGGNQFSANYVDNNVTTQITMQTNGPTMHVNFQHVANDGAASLTQGNYQLVSMQ